MIAYLRGNVIAFTAESVILETNGVGYEVFCSGRRFRIYRTTAGMRTYSRIYR